MDRTQTMLHGSRRGPFRNGGGSLRRGLLVAALAMPPSLATGQTPLPRDGADQHLGVVTCAGSTCHGASRAATRSSVLQNEFMTWHREDKHSEAYKVLLNQQSRRIADNLGLDAPEKAEICLNCHADNVPPARRGKRFQIADGVGCEACHGGAQRYLGPHLAVDGKGSDALVDLGLYPTYKPAARARLCLSCHMGSRDTLASHRIMGAGHPRLSIELDTFTDIQPAHYRIDADYRKRKGAIPGTQVWAVGQVVSARSFLQLFSAYQSRVNGLLPELFFYDCHACHRSLETPRWRPRRGVDLAPGSIRLNDAHLMMSSHLAAILAPQRKPAIDRAIAEFHDAAATDLARAVGTARRLSVLLEALERDLDGYTFEAEQMRDLLARLVAAGVDGAYRDYANAEQAAMALGSVIHAMRVMELLSAARIAAFDSSLDEIYRALQDPARYNPDGMVEAMRALQDRL